MLCFFCENLIKSYLLESTTSEYSFILFFLRPRATDTLLRHLLIITQIYNLRYLSSYEFY